jgi:hypothetical protein
VNLRRRWQLGQGISDPAFVPDLAYTNQLCPNLLRATYLVSILRAASSHQVLGIATLGGRRVWHLREQQYLKIDLYIDAGSFRLCRWRLWDKAGPATGWQVRFDYSRYNVPWSLPLSAVSAPTAH